MSSLFAGLRLRGHQRRAIFRTGERNMENTPQQRQQFVGSRHAVQPFSKRTAPAEYRYDGDRR